MSTSDHLSKRSAGSLAGTINATSLSKRFNREWIIRDFNYTFQPGIYAITGPNGSGKSTLLHMLWGQVPPTSGKIVHQLSGKDTDPDALIANIAIATPYMDLIEEFTLEEQLQFHFKMKTVRDNLSMEELMDIFYLREAKDKFIRNFSSGMRQRLKLGLAFYSDVSFIFLDEPGSHLDKKAFDWYRTELDKLPTDCTVLIGSNDPLEYPDHSKIIDMTAYKRAGINI